MKWLMSKSEWDEFYSSSPPKLICSSKVACFRYKRLISPQFIPRNLSQHMGWSLRRLLALYDWLLTTGDLQARYIRYVPGIVNINVSVQNSFDSVFLFDGQ